MPKPRFISPRVVLYTAGDALPHLPENTLALATLKTSAFGDGSHPTTRLCAGAVDLLCRQKPKLRVLDVGTGTAVLARIARARGASQVMATDVAPEALSSSQAHALLDPHPLAIEISDAAPDTWGPQFDLVVANILERPLHALAPALFGALAPGGQLLLSGFTALQTPFLRTRFESLGLAHNLESQLDGWALLALTKRFSVTFR